MKTENPPVVHVDKKNQNERFHLLNLIDKSVLCPTVKSYNNKSQLR